MLRNQWYIGCAGWSIPSAHAAAFGTEGSHLQRYSTRFRAVEINSSFYRPHRPTTYARWAGSVPEDFRFAVKIPKEITHTRRLRDTEVQAEQFLDEVSSLGTKLGPLLVQLPPSLAFDMGVVGAFFEMMRERFQGEIVCEPRHVSWFTTHADDVLSAHRIARVAADPAIVPQASVPGGWHGMVYYRLHGSPRMYYSAYGVEYIGRFVQKVAHLSPHVAIWCIFDNTAEGAATEDALWLQQKRALLPDSDRS
jgi:uncharacterized protein YecE (DUF72 family)